MRDLHTARDIAAFLTGVGVRVEEATIRQWAKRGHIRRRGTGPNGAALYDPAEVHGHAENRALAGGPEKCHTEASSACPFSEGGPAGAANSPGPGPTSWSRT